MNSTSLPPRPIVPIVVLVDEIMHREANGYRCSDATCPCSWQAPAPGYTDEEKVLLDELAQEQEDVGASFLYWSTDD